MQESCRTVSPEVGEKIRFGNQTGATVPGPAYTHMTGLQLRVTQDWKNSTCQHEMIEAQLLLFFLAKNSSTENVFCFFIFIFLT